jgi:hypothetical protein
VAKWAGRCPRLAAARALAVAFRHEKMEAEKVAADASCLRGSYIYLTYGKKPSSAFLWQ